MLGMPSRLWLVPALAWVLSFFQGSHKYLEDYPINATALHHEYDYIVVGGGSAGSVVAARLSEDAGVQVLLLEAGGQETTLSEVPTMAATLQLTPMDWQYRTEPSSTSCLAMVDNRCLFPRGRVVGGSSSINYMLYVRGNQRDYDAWEAAGNPGWGFRHLLPFFVLSEDNTDPTVDPDYHGTGGLATVGRAPWSTLLAETFLKAGLELGYQTTDCNGARQTGFMTPHGSIRRGARCSNAKAFLRPARERPNLHVALETFVTKVLIKDRKAVGVAFDRGESRGEVVLARREVVLAGGAINTPQLLMLSGVGPGRHLASLGLPVVADLPVGRNLQDHIGAAVIFTVSRAVSLRTERVTSLSSLLLYSLQGSGPLSTFGGVEGIAFVNSRYANASDDWPDVQFQFVSGSYASDGGTHLRHALGLRQEYWTDYFAHLVDREHFTVQVKLARPSSTGWVRLRSADPYDHPEIVTNYLKEKEDVLILLDGIKTALKLGNTTAFRKLGSRLYERPVPGCEHHPSFSEAYWECCARHLTLTIYHYCCTAKMGPQWDPTAVVDHELRVHGVSRLRVVDASAMPRITTGNTNAPVTMLAEKAASMIRAQWQDVPGSAYEETTTTTTTTTTTAQHDDKEL